MTVRRLPTLIGVAVLVVLAVCVGPAQSAFPGAKGRIVFASDRDGTFDVYAMSADGSGQTRLTTATGDDQYPMWSADGTKLVFSSAREGNNKIFRMSADGSAQTRLTDPAPAFGDEEPSWSRDGNRIAFRSDRELDSLHIWTMNADGTGLVRLTSVGFNFNPVWSPIDVIAFTSDRDGDQEIFTMDRFGTNVVQRTTNTALDSNPDWSPDGTKIAFQSNLDGDFDVWVLNTNTGALTQLTDDPAFDSGPTWSPDGTELAFQSNRDGDFEIYKMNADGSGVVQLTTNTAIDRVADWQPLTAGGGDTTPPTILLPANLVVDATSRTGTAVSFTVTVSDVVDPNPTLRCSHASAATFAIGVTTVSCTATDRAGNTSTGSFAVTVRGAKAQIETLLQQVIAASGLRPTQKAFLVSRLQTLLANFDPDNPAHRFTACNAVGIFAIAVSMWSGNPIPPALADRWLADARRIRSVLGC